MLCCVELSVLCHVVSFCVVLCCVVLCCDVLCCVVLCHVVSCCVVLLDLSGASMVSNVTNMYVYVHVCAFVGTDCNQHSGVGCEFPRPPRGCQGN